MNTVRANYRNLKVRKLAIIFSIKFLIITLDDFVIIIELKLFVMPYLILISGYASYISSLVDCKEVFCETISISYKNLNF